MRLFVGVDLPGEIKDALWALEERLRPQAPEAMWVPRDNNHLTMSFLGEVVEGRVPPILEALRATAMEASGPIETALDGVGAFPSDRRARVLWAGLEDGQDRLGPLARAVASALEPLGFPPEKRAWTPHLTIARFRTPGDARGLVTADLDPVPFTVPAITLFRSHLARPAPRYEILATSGLGITS
jgi:2'-5' RNA ligase